MTTKGPMEKQGKYYINSYTPVWLRYAIELADNDEQGEGRQVLMLAPAVNDAEEYLWLETNGEPVPVGVLLPDDGGVEYLADAAEWIDEPQSKWIVGAIADLLGE